MQPNQIIIDQFLKLLEQNADEKYRQGNLMTVPTKLKVIGVRVPIQRKIAKEWIKENKNFDDKELIELFKACWQQNIFEIRSLTLEILQVRKKLLKEFDWQILESWLKKVDNWGHCDVLSCNLFGFLVLQDQSYLKKLKSYLKKSNKWFQRAGIVSTLQLIRKKKIKADKVLRMIDEVVDNKDPMVQKAISWVLREMVRADYKKEVEKYIYDNKEKLASYVVREVNNKLQTGLKSGKIKRDKLL